MLKLLGAVLDIEQGHGLAHNNALPGYNNGPSR